jgi:prepilin-type N-terminal cleavage/methylation domain-containing protein
MKQKGFTLIELLVVIAIIGLLASVVLVALNSARANSRDARRVSDARQLATALSLYYANTGDYPPNNPASQDVGGWNVSYKPSFLADLIPSVISTPPKDPVNLLSADFSFFGPKTGSYFYAFYHYPASLAPGYGCSFNNDFAVIAVRQLEGGRKADTPKAACGTPPPGGCPSGGIANVCRDWSTEFDYSILVGG